MLKIQLCTAKLCPFTLRGKAFLQKKSFFRALNDGLEHGEISGKGVSSFRGEGVGRLGPRFGGEFGTSDEAGVGKSTEVRDEIAITHLQFDLEVLKGPISPRSEQGHEGKAGSFVYDLVELGEIDHARERREDQSTATP